MHTREVAQTIQNQLKQTLGMAVIWSWGQTALQMLSTDDCESLGIENSLGALKFKVNGHHHKGHVIVSLNGSDTYDVFICNVRSGKMTIKDECLGLYNDEFGTWIDEQVEKIAEYAF
jgi:hypothetical protein